MIRLFLVVLCCLASCSGINNNRILNDEVKLPIIYSDGYNISVMNLEKFHPFDTRKYEKVYNYLLESFNFPADTFFKPKRITYKELLKVHSADYLESLKESENIADIAELGPLSLLSPDILTAGIINPMKLATGGTCVGAELALKRGWAMNLSGGYHHAKSDEGGGFCFFADINIAALKTWEKNPEINILVVDLDAHQGNGHEAIFENEPRAFIFDMYNEDNYPYDGQAKKYIDFDIPLKPGIKDAEYLNILYENFPSALDSCQPGLIIYNAGSDIFSEDELGGMNISEEGIINRDEFIFKMALDKKIPILMVLSGGYSKKSGRIIGKSIENILRNVIKI